MIDASIWRKQPSKKKLLKDKSYKARVALTWLLFHGGYKCVLSYSMWTLSSWASLSLDKELVWVFTKSNKLYQVICQASFFSGFLI